MTDWTAGFELPDEQWVFLDARAVDGPEEAARRIAERGGELDHAYAASVLPELRVLCEQAGQLGAGPVAALVPMVPRVTRPLVPATARVVPQLPPEAGRTTAAIAAVVGAQQPYHYLPPEVTEVALPLGPGCRTYEVVFDGEGTDGRPALRESISWFVLPDNYPEGVLEFTVTWPGEAAGPEMLEIAAGMASTLALRPAGALA